MKYQTSKRNSTITVYQSPKKLIEKALLNNEDLEAHPNCATAGLTVKQITDSIFKSKSVSPSQSLRMKIRRSIMRGIKNTNPGTKQNQKRDPWLVRKTITVNRKKICYYRLSPLEKKKIFKIKKESTPIKQKTKTNMINKAKKISKKTSSTTPTTSSTPTSSKISTTSKRVKEAKVSQSKARSNTIQSKRKATNFIPSTFTFSSSFPSLLPPPVMFSSNISINSSSVTPGSQVPVWQYFHCYWRNYDSQASDFLETNYKNYIEAKNKKTSEVVNPPTEIIKAAEDFSEILEKPIENIEIEVPKETETKDKDEDEDVEVLRKCQVKSGGLWNYEVDFKFMKQTNLDHFAHTTRDIRRIIC